MAVGLLISLQSRGVLARTGVVPCIIVSEVAFLLLCPLCRGVLVSIFVVVSKVALLPLRALPRGMLVGRSVVDFVVVSKDVLLPLGRLSNKILVSNFVVVSKFALPPRYPRSERTLVGQWITLRVILCHPLTSWIVECCASVD